MLLFLTCLGTSCASISNSIKESKIIEAEQAELHGRNDFWGYANPAYEALGTRDYPTAQKLYLRAYRTTGVPLLGTRPDARDPHGIGRSLFGLIGEMSQRSSAKANAVQLDALTPLPGIGPATNQVLDDANTYCRSLAAYNWGIAMGHLGEFEKAERALLYALELERVRASRSCETNLFVGRHFELGRLYAAWGKKDVALKYFRTAMSLLPQAYKVAHPADVAHLLDEFAEILTANGEATEAALTRNESTALRVNNPNNKSKFRPDPPYPKQ